MPFPAFPDAHRIALACALHLPLPGAALRRDNASVKVPPSLKARMVNVRRRWTWPDQARYVYLAPPLIYGAARLNVRRSTALRLALRALPFFRGRSTHVNNVAAYALAFLSEQAFTICFDVASV